MDVKRELPVWSKLDYIASISEEVGEKFVETFPTLKDKIIPIENILSSRFIRQRAEEEVISLDSNPSTTIGRFSNPKKMEEIPIICRKIVDAGIDIKWFIIGYGSTEIEQEVRDNAQREGVTDRVILLGKKENPYPYIKACDIYVQPSRYEGKSITVREAQILCKPVIVTNYPTASSQIHDGVDGIIVPMEVDACAQEIVEFIRDKEKQKRIVAYLKEHDYGNENEMEKIYQLVDA